MNYSPSSRTSSRPFLLLPLLAVAALSPSSPVAAAPSSAFLRTPPRSRFGLPFRLPRGGGAEGADGDAEEPSPAVRAALEDLGLGGEEGGTAEATCRDGVCELPPAGEAEGAEKTEAEKTEVEKTSQKIDEVLALAQTDGFVCERGEAGAALAAAAGDVGAAHAILKYEYDMLKSLDERADAVEALSALRSRFPSHPEKLIRRALAMTEADADDAAAILAAEEEDAVDYFVEMGASSDMARAALRDSGMDVTAAETLLIKRVEEEKERAAAAETAKRAAEEAAAEKRAMEDQMQEVVVPANFDPTAIGGKGGAASAAPSNGAPAPARKEDVVFEATGDTVQKIIMESPVPVLLDIYADWCGPCKHLGPILEEMAVKAGGAFRLVKLNSDNERPLSSALEIQALPTVFGIRDGAIVNSWQGFPQEEALKSFMMSLLTGSEPSNPALTQTQKDKNKELSLRLARVAGAAGFSFSARERMQERIESRLDALVDEAGGPKEAEASAQVLRALLSNLARDPVEPKFRRVNLENPKIQARVAAFPACLAVLRAAGFKSTGQYMEMQGGKVLNVAPVSAAADMVQKWIKRNAAAMSAAARKRQDDADRANLVYETEDEEEEEEAAAQIDPEKCVLRARIEGKKRVHDLTFAGEDTPRELLRALGVNGDNPTQITCAAKRLVIKSEDEGQMGKSFRELGLVPRQSVVVKVAAETEPEDDAVPATTSLKERGASQRSRRRRSQTMQSVGIYGRDDHLKGNLVDNGDGVMYEQDVSDTEEEEEEEDVEEEEEEEYDDEGEEGGESTDASK